MKASYSLTLLLNASLCLCATAQQASLKGIELTDMDLKAQPCDNFYDFANGSWRANNPIPASMQRWSRRWQAGEANKDKLQTILDQLASGPEASEGSPAQVSGDFYAACLNVKAIDAAGLTPLQPLLARIDGIQTSDGLEREIRELQALGVTAPFGFDSSPNQHDPNQVIADISASGLGMPDRDYYVKPEKRFADARAAYLLYIAKVWQLAGANSSDAASSAKTVMDFETDLAKASLDNVALRDPAALDHIVGFGELQKMTPHFDWSAFYGAENIPQGPVNVDQPAFLADIERQLTATPMAAWKTYLRWQLLNAVATSLPQAFVDAHFDFYESQLAGVKELKPRGTRCAEQTDLLLGEASGQEYVKRYFPPEAKLRAQEMVTNIVAAMHDTIETLDWMTPETRQKALEKLATLRVKVGYPDKWKDYSSLTIGRADYFADVIAARRFVAQDDWATIGKPVDRHRWGMTPPTSDASYNPLLNDITFPAGILQPPAFSVGATDAVNYGAIGVVIGHEITHGFDDQGAQFDAQGRLSNWWTNADLSKFHAKTECVATQFDNYSIDGSPDVHINGKLVLGESIADLGGVKIAYLAFQKTAQARSGAKIDGFTPNQQFFIAWGQFRGDETRPEAQRLMVQDDPHPVAKYRVLGPLSNFPPFAATFSCKPGAPMVRPDVDRCVVW